MAETKEKLPSVQEHAQSIMDRVIAERGTVENAEEARMAAAVPAFSTGTAAIGKDGKAIVPKKQATEPEFAESQVALPGVDGSEKVEPEGSPASKEAILAAHQERLKTAAAAKAGAVAPAEPAAAEVAIGTEAAETAADDIWAEMDEFTFSDPDIEVDIPIRVPKKFSETAKRGYGRRSKLDKEIRFATEAAPVLRQLIEDGTLHNVIPLIQFARDNPEYGALVTQAFERAKKGLPLIEQAKIEAAAAAIPAPVPDAASLGLDNPFFTEELAPLRGELNELKTWKQQQEEQRQRQASQQAEQRAIAERNSAETKLAHEDLARAYPDHVRLDMGPNDPFFRKAVEQARLAGYGIYGIRAGIVFGAQAAMQIDAERTAASGSPTADALRQAESKHGELARQEAAASSRKVAAGAPLRATPPPPPQPPSTMNADGTMKAPGQYRDEMLRYIEATQGQPA